MDCMQIRTQATAILSLIFDNVLDHLFLRQLKISKD